MRKKYFFDVQIDVKKLIVDNGLHPIVKGLYGSEDSTAVVYLEEPQIPSHGTQIEQ